MSSLIAVVLVLIPCFGAAVTLSGHCHASATLIVATSTALIIALTLSLALVEVIPVFMPCGRGGGSCNVQALPRNDRALLGTAIVIAVVPIEVAVCS